MSSDAKESDAASISGSEEDPMDQLKKTQFEQKHMELKEKLKRLKSVNNSGAHNDANSADSAKEDKEEEEGSSPKEVTTGQAKSDNKSKFLQLKEKLRRLKEANSARGVGRESESFRSASSGRSGRSNDDAESPPAGETAKREPAPLQKDRETLRAKLKEKLEKFKREYGICDGEKGRAAEQDEQQEEQSMPRDRTLSKGYPNRKNRKRPRGGSDSTINRSTSRGMKKRPSSDSRDLYIPPGRNRISRNNPHERYRRGANDSPRYSSPERAHRKDYRERMVPRWGSSSLEERVGRDMRDSPRRGRSRDRHRRSRDGGRSRDRVRSRDRHRRSRDRDSLRNHHISLNARERGSRVRDDDHTHFRREERQNKYLYNQMTGEKVEKKFFRVPLGYHTTKESWNNYTQWLQKKNDYRFGLPFDQNKIFRRSQSLSPSTWKKFVPNSEEDDDERVSSGCEHGEKAGKNKSKKHKKSEKAQRGKHHKGDSSYVDEHSDEDDNARRKRNGTSSNSKSLSHGEKGRHNSSHKSHRRKRDGKKYSRSMSSGEEVERGNRSIEKEKRRRSSVERKKSKAEKKSSKKSNRHRYRSGSRGRSRSRSSSYSDSHKRDKKKHKERKYEEGKRRSEKKKKKSKHEEKKKKRKSKDEESKRKSKRRNKTKKDSEYSDSIEEKSDAAGTSATSLSFLCEGYDSLHDKDMSREGSGDRGRKSEENEEALVEEEEGAKVTREKSPSNCEDSSGEGSDVGPKPLDVNVKLANQQIDYGAAMMPGEGQAIAQFVQKGKRIPRRGEVGLSAEAIENFESLGYVMSGSRHKRMNAIRMRKENQVYSAEEQRALAMFNYEERANRENALISDLKEVLRKQNEAILNESKNN
ncbi:hypothetical protein AK88_01007 [Plasmodium fragile]|uniref:NF-kappa-B-activating protein C-terminal domain-containing protein n=1 Tax=Plasmodium fragile TaxID=5857 RepID=A0A0D9QTW0_PLAFR|nr:uncharacterized protein AK88_01007 [Plasmodium fragile]KJP89341.1 hypothetical protein AK88_01007 [Plasmodium fragile]